MEESAYSLLFEPIRIGPVSAKNRLAISPHANGMGATWPSAYRELWRTRAEGGWGILSTEICMIHPTSDAQPSPDVQLWDDDDVKRLAPVFDVAHAYGALAAVELGHLGLHASNGYTREAALGPSALSVSGSSPFGVRVMDANDIRDFRKWHTNAALRAMRAGADIVYVYVAHGLGLPMQFMSRRHNQRCDEYGGSLTNRVRLTRELLEETKDAIGARCAVGIRFSVDELMGSDGMEARLEGRDVVSMLADIPDLWSVNVADWSNDTRTSRFAKEASQQPFVDFVKQVTSKPVMGVGWFTSPDTMVAQVRSGLLDIIACARPAIADPFLPAKIANNSLERIRECIGCNVCVASDTVGVPIRCTQNPTIGEEWRRGWHPERVPPRRSDGAVLVVGGGPAGLEAALVLAKRGHQVQLAEAGRDFGGRINSESSLPGLTEWGRVRDFRLGQLKSMVNVSLYLDSSMDAETVREVGAPHIVLATGAAWRRDGVGRETYDGIAGAQLPHVKTPDDIFCGWTPSGARVLIYDEDHYVMASGLAEKFTAAGHQVTLVTPESMPSAWTVATMEQPFIHRRLLEKGVKLCLAHRLVEIGPGRSIVACVHSGSQRFISADSVVLATGRIANDRLDVSLREEAAANTRAGIVSINLVGDAYAPGTIATAIYSAHRAARNLGETRDPYAFRREGLVPCSLPDDLSDLS